MCSGMLGCTTATRATSRSSSEPARHTPQAIGRSATAASAAAWRPQRPPARTDTTSVATSPLTSASQKVTPRLPTISAIPTSSGKPVSEEPRPSQGKAIVLGRWARDHSRAVHTTGRASQSGMRSVFTARCSVQPKYALMTMRMPSVAR